MLKTVNNREIILTDNRYTIKINVVKFITCIMTGHGSVTTWGVQNPVKYIKGKAGVNLCFSLSDCYVTCWMIFCQTLGQPLYKIYH